MMRNAGRTSHPGSFVPKTIATRCNLIVVVAFVLISVETGVIGIAGTIPVRQLPHYVPNESGEGRSERIVASMVSEFSKASNLDTMIGSLAGQVDLLNLFLIGYPDRKVDRLPSVLHQHWINFEYSEDHKITSADGAEMELGMWGQFVWCKAEELSFRGYHFFVDQDLIYPPNYILEMKDRIDRYSRNAVVSLSGWQLQLSLENRGRPFESLQRNSYYFDSVNMQSSDEPLHLIESKTLGWHNQAVTLDVKKAVADIWYSSPSIERGAVVALLSHYLNRKGVPLVAVDRPKGWIGYSRSTGSDARRGLLSDAEDKLMSSIILKTFDDWRISKVKPVVVSTPLETLLPPVLAMHPTIASLLGLFDELHQKIISSHPFGTGMEGSISGDAEKIILLSRIAMSPFIETVCEIGFNAGHSSLLWLHFNPRVKLISFDLWEHNYSETGLEYINLRFPNRITMVKGDSTKTIPEFVSKNPDVKCDVMHIDGGHYDDVPEQDMRNFYGMVNWEVPQGNVLVLDDTNCTASYCIACNELWQRWIGRGLLREHLCWHGADESKGHCVGTFLRERS